MADFQIKKAIEVGSESGKSLQQFGIMIFNIPKRFIKAMFKIQMEILYLPIRIFNSFYRLLLQKNEALENCDRSVQAKINSKQDMALKYAKTNGYSRNGLPCNKSVQAHPDYEYGSSCNKSVQAIPDIEHELSCNKIVQVSDSESDFSCDKSVQATSDSESDYSCDKSVQATSNSEIDYSCDKSVQATSDSESDYSCDKSVQATSDSESDYSCDKSVQAYSDAESEISCGKSVHASSDSDDLFCDKSVQTTSDLLQDLSKEYKNSRNADFKPVVLKTSAEYIRLSDIYLEKVLNGTHNLTEQPRIGYDHKPSTIGSTPIKNTQAKNGSQQWEFNPKDILKDTSPGVKQALRDINSQEKTVEEIKSILQHSKFIKNHMSTEIISKLEMNEETYTNSQQILNLSMDVLQHMVDAIMHEISTVKQRITTSNSQIEEVFKFSRRLSEEITKINEKFNRLITLSSKVTDLQNQLCNGNTVLKEVEAERNEMQVKLLALARLIKEEEEYLDDVSIESGYDDIEMRSTSPYRHDI